MSKGFFRSVALSVFLLTLFSVLISCAEVNTTASPAGAIKSVAADNTLEGKITKIDSDGTVTVLQENGRAIFIEVLADTKIFRNGKPAKVSALKDDDSVWVQYQPNFLPDFRKALEIRATGTN